MISAFVAIALALVVFSLIGGGFSLAPWVPTRTRDIARIHAMAKLRFGETLYELGCGDGRVCHALARLNPNCHIVGIELSPLLFAIAKLRNIVSPQQNLRLHRANIFEQNFADADVVYVFGMPEMLPKLQAKLERECSKPIRIISYSFPLKDQQKSNAQTKKKREIALYELII